jgi:CRP-like cAMP-binding protein
LLLSGTATVTASDGRGNQRLISIRAAGDLVGEKGALNGTARSATVRTCSPVRARLFGPGELAAFVATHPAALLAIVGMISDRLTWANRRRVDVVVASAGLRVAIVLCDLAERFWTGDPANPRVAVPLRQEDLATLAGAQPPTARLALRKLAESGYIERLYGRTVVTDVVRLRGYVQETDENP